MKSEVQQAFENLLATVGDTITIDNDFLRFQELGNAVEGKRSLNSINEKIDKAPPRGLSEHEQKKLNRQKNLELYASQVANGADICYNGNVDEVQKNKNEIAFLNVLERTRTINDEESIFDE